jgi:hypothetical protein
VFCFPLGNQRWWGFSFGAAEGVCGGFSGSRFFLLRDFFLLIWLPGFGDEGV